MISFLPHCLCCISARYDLAALAGDQTTMVNMRSALHHSISIPTPCRIYSTKSHRPCLGFADGHGYMLVMKAFRNHIAPIIFNRIALAIQSHRSCLGFADGHHMLVITKHLHTLLLHLFYSIELPLLWVRRRTC
jgi:hypothetical protein